MKTQNNNTVSLKEKKMNWTVRRLFLAAFIIISFISADTKAVNPTYELYARNFEFLSVNGGFQNAFTFDIYVKHTNPQQSDPFRYAYGQYFFNFNPDIANGGTLSVSLVPGTSEFPAPQPLPRIPSQGGINGGNMITLVANTSLQGNSPVVSSTSYGTRLTKVQITTTASEFANVPLNFRWRESLPNPYTKIVAWMETEQQPNVEITSFGPYQIDTTGVIPFPVEMENFNSTVNKNNVTLNWKTSTETNNSGFDIERKLVTADEWTKVNNVRGKGTTNEGGTYSYSEKLSSGKYNYRLKQIDDNGNFKYYNLTGEVNVGVPSEFNLSQNYPNPFNPTTKVDYEIPFDGKVSMILYDIAGREVAKLVDDVKTAGYYTVQLNGSSLASGMYFYRLILHNEKENLVNTKKMVLLK